MKHIIIFLALSSQLALAETGRISTRNEREGNGSFMQLRMEPQWLLFHEAGVDVQFRINDQLSLGPTLAIMRDNESIMYGTMTSTSLGSYKDKVNRESYGVRGVYYLNAFDRHSTFFSGFIRQSKSHVKTVYTGSLASTGEAKGEFTENTVGATAGYQWVWGAFTLNVGGGLASYSHPEKVAMADEQGNTSYRKTEGSNLSYALDAGIGVQF